MNFFSADTAAFFELLEKNNRERTLEIPDPAGIDLCSNDYLCLSQHPQLIAALKDGVEKYGAGSTASRLIRGHRDVFAALEQAYAAWVGAEAALFFANGYSANVGCISAICDGSYAAFIDRLSHASLVDGVRLSGAQKIYFRHNDMAHLEEQLQKNRAKKKIIITESLFSMDGDSAPVEALLALREKYGALLFIDDAHALGVYGKTGSGLAPVETDFRMATFGKALGLEGAMLATSASARKYLMHNARTFVFSTAPLPAIAYAALTAMELAQSMEAERSALQSVAQILRAGSQKLGIMTGNSSSHIIPLICESEQHALDAAHHLQQVGFHVKAIRPPTVKESRLRISLNAGITPKIAGEFLSALPSAFANR